MKLKYQNIISFNLLLLILFSTIGFHIISTMCDGCDMAQTSIAIAHTDHDKDLPCKCCNTDENKMCCCDTESSQEEDHHRSSSVFAKLNFDSPEAKTNTGIFFIPLSLFHVIIKITNENACIQKKAFRPLTNLSPPLGGRLLLTLICILKN